MAISFEDECAWERRMNALGSEAFDTQNENKLFSDTKTGLKKIREVLDQAEEGIKDLQSEYTSGSASVDRCLVTTILTLETGTLALLTIRNLFNMVFKSEVLEKGTPYQSVAKSLGSVIETELNYRNWTQHSKALEFDYAKKLVSEFGFNTQQARRWKKAYKELNEYAWTSEQKHWCGDALMGVVLEKLPQVFTVGNYYKTTGYGHPVKHIHFSPEFLASLNQHEAMISMTKVKYMPMLTIPKQWSPVALEAV